MKSVILLAALVSGISIAACAQQKTTDKVPAAVKVSFAKNYPGIDASWEKEKGNYEAGFKKDGHSMSAVFTAGGSLLESEADIPISDLPPAIKNYIKTSYPNKKIKEAAKITKADGSITYEAEVEGKDLIFDDKGNFMKESKE